jgi:RNA polymerase sigma-70 factor (ECF subfamily)
MDEPMLDVPACVERARAGDEDASRDLMRHLHPLVVKIVRSHLPRRTSEEDLIQAVFVKVFTRIEQYRGAVPFEHWVSRVAVNTCLNQIAHEKIRPEMRMADLSEEEEIVVQNLASTAGSTPTEDNVASRELVEKLMANLNPEDRLVISLLHLEQKSVEEVRQVTGWSAALVKVRAFRARAKMKKHLSALMEEKTK